MSIILCVICREELTTIVNSKNKSQRSVECYPVSTPCGHLYHSVCLKKWFKQKAENNVDHFRESFEPGELSREKYYRKMVELRNQLTCPTCNVRILENECHRVFLAQEPNHNSGPMHDETENLDSSNRTLICENEKLKEDLLHNKNELTFLAHKAQKLEKTNTLLEEQVSMQKSRIQLLKLQLSREKNANLAGSQNRPSPPEPDTKTSKKEETKLKVVKTVTKTEWIFEERPRKSKNWWQRFYNIYLSPGGRDY